MDEQNITAGFYRHYKGQNYEVLDTAIHSETLETVVVYRPLYGDRKLWVRPLSMFVETVLCEDKVVPRFRKCSNEELRALQLSQG
jgi:hypothetical protein